MVLPASEALREHLNESEYQKKVVAAAGSYEFKLMAE